MAFDLQSVLKALLFSSGQPLTIKDFQAVFARYHEQNQAPAAAAGEGAEAGEQGAEAEQKKPEPDAKVAADEPAEVDAPEAAEADVPELITAAQLREALDAIEAELRESNSTFLLLEGAQGYRLVCNPRLARWVRALRNEPPPAKLSQSALETLAVVAYRQPVTRSEIETVRGVSADAGLNKLLERELIYITGRAELPGRPLQYGTTEKFLEFVGVKSLVELPASDVLSPRQIDQWLQNAMNPTTPGDAEMGLPLEAGEGDSPMEDEAHIEVGERTHNVPDAPPDPAESADEPSIESDGEAGTEPPAAPELTAEETEEPEKTA